MRNRQTAFNFELFSSSGPKCVDYCSASYKKESPKEYEAKCKYWNNPDYAFVCDSIEAMGGCDGQWRDLMKGGMEW